VFQLIIRRKISFTNIHKCTI